MRIAKFLIEKPSTQIGALTVAQWVGTEGRASTSTYAARLAQGGWGGSVEIAIFAHLVGVTVAVYKPDVVIGEAKLVARFGQADPPSVHLLHVADEHYDVMLQDGTRGGGDVVEPHGKRYRRVISAQAWEAKAAVRSGTISSTEQCFREG